MYRGRKKLHNALCFIYNALRYVYNALRFVYNALRFVYIALRYIVFSAERLILKGRIAIKRLRSEKLKSTPEFYPNESCGFSYTKYFSYICIALRRCSSTGEWVAGADII